MAGNRSDALVSYGWHKSECPMTIKTATVLKPLVSNFNVTFCDMSNAKVYSNEIDFLPYFYPSKNTVERFFDLTKPKIVIDIHSYNCFGNPKKMEESAGFVMVGSLKNYINIGNVLTKSGLADSYRQCTDDDCRDFRDTPFDKRFSKKLYPALQVRVDSRVRDASLFEKEKNFIASTACKKRIPFFVPEVTNPEQMAIYLSRIIKGLSTTQD